MSFMQDAADEYQARLNAYTAGKDAVAMQREAPAIIASLIHRVSAEALTRCPANGGWSVRDILAHLADDELVSSWRYRQMLENSGVALGGFDQDQWARLGDYESWPPHEAFETFRLLRVANLRLFAKLTPDQWECHGGHAERGRITVAELARHMAGHDWNHMQQIRRLLDR